MKKVLFLGAAFAIFATTSFAQSKKATVTAAPAVEAKQATKVESAAITNAKIEFDATTIDLGNVPQGIPAEAEFVFTNKGKTPITLQNVKAACGCTTPNYTKETILPGKKGSIKASYNAATPGSFNKNITVTTEAGTETLWIKGNVEPTPESSVPSNNNMMKK